MTEKIDVLIDVKQVNNQMIVPTIATFVLSIGLYYLIWGFVWDITLIGFVKVYGICFIGIILHELIHGIAFIIFGKAKLLEVKFGVLWKSFTPYAHCKIPLKLKAYRIALLAPVIITGFIPLIIALFIDSLALVIVAAFLITAGAGDWIMYKLLKPFPANAKIIDHPSEVGCIVEMPEVRENI